MSKEWVHHPLDRMIPLQALIVQALGCAVTDSSEPRYGSFAGADRYGRGLHRWSVRSPR